MKYLNNLSTKLGLALTGLFAASSSFAAGVDYSGITGQVDFTTAATAVVAIAGFIALVKVAISGARKVLGMIR